MAKSIESGAQDFPKRKGVVVIFRENSCDDIKIALESLGRYGIEAHFDGSVQ
jgi:hypothetical protein